MSDIVALIDHPADAQPMLSHYLASKSEQPCISALFILPDTPEPSWQPLLKGMLRSEVLSASELSLPVPSEDTPTLPRKFVVMYDPPRTRLGVLRADSLPSAVQLLHVRTAPKLTFVFRATAAGVPATVLWDSGAALSFVDERYVARHKLAVKPHKQAVELADGSLQHVSGSVTVKLRINGVVTSATLLVLNLTPGFDVILGDDWSTKHRVLADFGYADPVHGDNCRANLLLRTSNKRLYPEYHPVTPTLARDDKPAKATLISARKAARLLAMPAAGCRPAFLVYVRGVPEPVGDAAPDTNPALDNLLDRFAEVFEAPDASAVRPDLTPEVIPLMPDAVPPDKPAFRMSLKERAVLEEHVTEQLGKDWLTTSTSAFGAPVLFVPKPDGSLRMCIDYRELNRITVKNKYPLPRIDDLMDNLSGAKYFSSLDLTSGYHQLVLPESDRHKTAFNTHFGKYEYKVLPMGLSNAPAVFQAAMHFIAMNKVFGPLLNKCVCVYLDDILVFSKTPEDHLQHLEKVLTILKQQNLKAKRKKCEFFKPELKFLGHIVSASGMRPDPAKVATVKDWPTPVSAYEVRSFLGLANYFRKYIRAYSAIAAPLTDLLKGLDASDRKGKLLRWTRLPPAEVEAIKAAFAPRWTSACADAFECLKQALTSAPVLTLPDLAKPFELVCDACECPPAVGAVLLQDGKPNCFHSRKLNGPELQYSATDREMLAVIDALREWRCYLEGAPFTIVTDHEPNTYLDKSTNPHTIKRRGRWLAVSCGYDYTWVYRPGRMNVADPVSRAPQLFALQCARTAVAHSLKACRYGRRLGSASVASGSESEGPPGMASCCHVCSCVPVTAPASHGRVLAAVPERDAATATAERPTDLPLPPGPQTARNWRSPRRAGALKGGSDYAYACAW